MEIQEGGELLKVLYATLGRRPTKIVAWIFLFIALIFATKWGIEGLDWLANRFGVEQFNLSMTLETILAVIIMAVMLCGVGIAGGLLLAIPLRFGIDITQRHKVEFYIKDALETLYQIQPLIMSEQDNIKITNAIHKLEMVSKPLLIFRILDRLFPASRPHQKKDKDEK